MTAPKAAPRRRRLANKAEPPTVNILDVSLFLRSTPVPQASSRFLYCFDRRQQSPILSTPTAALGPDPAWLPNAKLVEAASTLLDSTQPLAITDGHCVPGLPLSHGLFRHNVAFWVRYLQRVRLTEVQLAAQSRCRLVDNPTLFEAGEMLDDRHGPTDDTAHSLIL